MRVLMLWAKKNDRTSISIVGKDGLSSVVVDPCAYMLIDYEVHLDMIRPAVRFCKPLRMHS